MDRWTDSTFKMRTAYTRKHQHAAALFHPTLPGCTHASSASKAATSSTPLAVSLIVKQFMDSGEHVIISGKPNIPRTPHRRTHRRHPSPATSWPVISKVRFFICFDYLALYLCMAVA
jgi:hypothetical protein